MLLNELSSSLRSEVIKHTYGQIITNIKFFSNKSTEFLWAVLPMLKSIKIHAKDVVYN